LLHFEQDVQDYKKQTHP